MLCRFSSASFDLSDLFLRNSTKPSTASNNAASRVVKKLMMSASIDAITGQAARNLVDSSNPCQCLDTSGYKL